MLRIVVGRDRNRCRVQYGLVRRQETVQAIELHADAADVEEFAALVLVLVTGKGDLGEREPQQCRQRQGPSQARGLVIAVLQSRCWHRLIRRAGPLWFVPD